MPDALRLTFSCPECGHQTQKTIRRVKARQRFLCSSCDREVDLDVHELQRLLERATHAVKQTRRQSSRPKRGP